MRRHLRCCIALLLAIVGGNNTTGHPLVIVIVILLVPNLVVVHGTRPFGLRGHRKLWFLSRVRGRATGLAGGQTGTLPLVTLRVST